jgi:prepilin-type N-terminal cleavage/methylation domain-containing protein
MTKKGMTLTEILIVVGIISFLAVLITVYLRTQVFKGYDARKKAEIKRIGIAAEEYEKDNNCYPLSNQVICNPGTGLRPYLDKVPCDPLTQASYYYEHEDAICPKWYRIYAVLNNDSDKDAQSYIGPGSAFNFVYGSSNSPAVTQSTPPPGGQDLPPDTNFYGCFSGVCTPITWDSARPGPICDPNFQNSTCYGQCANPGNECQPWN